MLKQGLINRDLLAYAAELGHTDSFVIADCGLPIPEHVPVVNETTMTASKTAHQAPAQAMQ